MGRTIRTNSLCESDERKTENETHGLRVRKIVSRTTLSPLPLGTGPNPTSSPARRRGPRDTRSLYHHPERDSPLRSHPSSQTSERISMILNFVKGLRKGLELRHRFIIYDITILYDIVTNSRNRSSCRVHPSRISRLL